MSTCFFVSDLHGRSDRYRKLFSAIESEKPRLVFLGGDLLPPFIDSLRREESTGTDFVDGVLRKGFADLRTTLREDYPSVFLIPGNDDPRSEEELIEIAGKDGVTC